MRSTDSHQVPGNHDCYSSQISDGIVGGKNNINTVNNYFKHNELVNFNDAKTVSYLPMPCHNQLFTGRDTHLETLGRYFCPRDTSYPSRRFLVHGMGGAGKTQICLRFVENISTRFWRILWVDATTDETIELSLQNIAADPDIRAFLGVDRPAKSVLQCLSTVKHDWLIVFDNASDGVVKYLPRENRGNILFTSRNPHLAGLAVDRIEVNDMEDEDAVSLLLRSSRINEISSQARQAARQIVKELFCLPLAVDQAGAAIATGLCDIDDYLDMYYRHRQELLADATFEGASGYGRAVYGTWDLSVTAIKKKAARDAENAILILQTFAFFHHENIAEEIFKRAAECSRKSAIILAPQLVQLLQLDQNGHWDPFFFREGIRILVSYSLIRKGRFGGIFSLHPLVHRWIRDSMSDEERGTSVSLASTVLSSSIEFYYATKDYGYRRTLMPHISTILENQWSYDDDRYKGFSTVFQEAGHWKEAEKLELQAVETRKRLLGNEDPETLRSIYSLVSTYFNQGRLEEAEELGAALMETRKRVIGEEHPDTLASMQVLASTYENQGRSKEAEDLGIQVMEMSLRVLGEEHPETLMSMNNLAMTYGNQGRWKESQELDIRVMETRKRVLGEEHPNTLMSMNNLAVTYWDQGQWKESEELNLQVMEARKRVLGEEHPETLMSMHNLAMTYTKQGRWKEAEELEIQVMKTRERVLGGEHPDTLESMRNLAWMSQEQGTSEEAEALQVKVPDTVLDMGHSYTITENVPSTHRNPGRWKRLRRWALKLFKPER